MPTVCHCGVLRFIHFRKNNATIKFCCFQRIDALLIGTMHYWIQWTAKLPTCSVFFWWERIDPRCCVGGGVFHCSSKSTKTKFEVCGAHMNFWCCIRRLPYTGDGRTWFQLHRCCDPKLYVRRQQVLLTETVSCWLTLCDVPFTTVRRKCDGGCQYFLTVRY